MLTHPCTNPIRVTTLATTELRAQPPTTRPMPALRVVCGQPATGGPCHQAKGHRSTCLPAPVRQYRYQAAA